MGSQLLDLVTQKQADTQCPGNDASAIKQEIPWFYPTQQGIGSPLMQVGYGKIRLARKYYERDEQVCNHHQQH
jgi:hypothetical protein